MLATETALNLTGSRRRELLALQEAAAHAAKESKAVKDPKDGLEDFA